MRPVLRAATCAVALLLAGAGPDQAAERKVWSTSLQDHDDFLRYTSPVGGVPFTKFVIVADTGTVYYFWTAVYPFHYHFVTEVLLAGQSKDEHYQDLSVFNQAEHKGDKRRLILGALGYRNGLYAFEFLESDVLPPHELRRTYDVLAKSFPAGASKLRYRPLSDGQRAMLAKVPDLPWVAADFVTSGGEYQLLSPGKAAGKLRIVGADQDVAALALDPGDVVVLARVPDDIAPVSGILSARFTSPLGHVNLRARAWGIPNAGLKDAMARARPLEGKVVYYEARPDGATLREATDEEATKWADRRQTTSRAVRVPASDLSYKGLPDLVGLRAADVVRVGTKAANLGELATLGGEGAYEVPGGFVVPFAWYVEHLQAHGLTVRVRAMLDDPAITGDRARREKELAALRKAIVEAPMDAVLAERIAAKVKQRFPGRGVFVRSSTNAEDLPGFNGAGLYDTVPNVKGDAALVTAVKTVWASVWNFRAHEERTRAGIDHRACYPAVLLQVGVDADGAGVMITQNVFDPAGGPGVYLNAKRGLGIRVVGGDRIPEQVLFDETTREIRVISRSSDPVALRFDDAGGVREVAASGEPFLNTPRIRALVKAARRVRAVFPEGPQDVEWLITGEERVWVVQSRPYVQGGS